MFYIVVNNDLIRCCVYKLWFLIKIHGILLYRPFSQNEFFLIFRNINLHCRVTYLHQTFQFYSYLYYEEFHRWFVHISFIAWIYNILFLKTWQKWFILGCRQYFCYDLWGGEKGSEDPDGTTIQGHENMGAPDIRIRGHQNTRASDYAGIRIYVGIRISGHQTTRAWEYKGTRIQGHEKYKDLRIYKDMRTHTMGLDIPTQERWKWNDDLVLAGSWEWDYIH